MHVGSDQRSCLTRSPCGCCVTGLCSLKVSVSQRPVRNGPAAGREHGALSIGSKWRTVIARRMQLRCVGQCDSALWHVWGCPCWCLCSAMRLPALPGRILAAAMPAHGSWTMHAPPALRSPLSAEGAEVQHGASMDAELGRDSQQRKLRPGGPACLPASMASQLSCGLDTRRVGPGLDWAQSA